MTRRDRAVPALPGLGGDAGPPRVRRVRRGVDLQLRAQRALGHLEAVDEGLVALARTLADAIDEEWAGPEPSSFTVQAVAGKLTPILLHLRGEHAGATDIWESELEQIRSAIRDTTGSGSSEPG